MTRSATWWSGGPAVGPLGVVDRVTQEYGGAMIEPARLALDPSELPPELECYLFPRGYDANQSTWSRPIHILRLTEDDVMFRFPGPHGGPCTNCLVPRSRPFNGKPLASAWSTSTVMCRSSFCPNSKDCRPLQFGEWALSLEQPRRLGVAADDLAELGLLRFVGGVFISHRGPPRRLRRPLRFSPAASRCRSHSRRSWSSLVRPYGLSLARILLLVGTSGSSTRRSARYSARPSPLP